MVQTRSENLCPLEMLNARSSLAYIIDVADMLSLGNLSSDIRFTNVIRDKDIDVADNDFHRFVDDMTNKFHDHVSLNSEQRAVVREHLEKKDNLAVQFVQSVSRPTAAHTMEC